MIGRGAHTAGVEEDLEGGAEVTSARFQMNTVRIGIESLAEDHPVERTIELDVDAHVSLLALHLQMLDLGRIGRGERPVLLGTSVRASRCTVLSWRSVDRAMLQRQRAAVHQWCFAISALEMKDMLALDNRVVCIYLELRNASLNFKKKQVT